MAMHRKITHRLAPGRCSCTKLLSPKFRPLRLASILVFAMVAFEFRPLPASSEDESTLQVEQTISGIDSRLKPVQYAKIGDEATWRRVWLSHLGEIDQTTSSLPFPSVDFTRSNVIAIVEKPDGTSTSGLRAHRVWVDDEILLIDYEPTHSMERARKRRPGNVFVFFVISRVDYPTVLRRASIHSGEQPTDASFVQVASFPASSSDRPMRFTPDPNRLSNRMLNIVFAHDAGLGNYDGVIGYCNDIWNMASVGTTAIDFLRYSDATPSTARMRVSRHDGAWGVTGQHGISPWLHLSQLSLRRPRSRFA